MMTHQELAQALLDWVSADTKNRSVVAVLSTDKDPTDNEYTSSFVMVGSKMLTIRGWQEHWKVKTMCGHSLKSHWSWRPKWISIRNQTLRRKSPNRKSPTTTQNDLPF